jgi:hypothetical protein
MSKRLLTRSLPKTVKGYRIEVPTHHQKEETDIHLLRMTSDMLYKTIPNTKKALKTYTMYKKTTVHTKYPCNQRPYPLQSTQEPGHQV